MVMIAPKLDEELCDTGPFFCKGCFEKCENCALLTVRALVLIEPLEDWFFIRLYFSAKILRV